MEPTEHRIKRFDCPLCHYTCFWCGDTDDNNKLTAAEDVILHLWLKHRIGTNV